MEDKNQVLLEVEKDLRDEIKMRIKQRDAYYAQAIAFCGALLAFGLTKFGDNSMGGIVLCCGPFVALSYWRLLMESYYVHDKIKLYLIQEVESRFDVLVGNDFCSWQRHCAKGESVSGNQKDTITRIMLGGALIVYLVAIVLHGLRIGLLSPAHSLAAQISLLVVYALLAILWILLAVGSFKSMNGKYCNLNDGKWQIHFWPSKGKTP